MLPLGIWKLPNEIWSDIASRLRKRDLTKLARTCRFFLLICRPILYRNVDLRRHECSWHAHAHATETLKFLTSDAQIAGGIRSICLSGQSFVWSKENPQVTQPALKVFARATSLTDIRIFGRFFESESQQSEFVSGAESRVFPLTTLEICDESLFDDDLCISCLVEFTWNGGARPALWSLLQSSRTSLENISLNVKWTNVDDLNPFWDLCFPLLKEFKLGDEFEQEWVLGSEKIIGWLNFHSRLRMKRLGLSVMDYNDFVFTFNNQTLKETEQHKPVPETQLKCGSFIGDSDVFADLLRSVSTSIRGVQVLEMDTFYYNSPHTFEECSVWMEVQFEWLFPSTGHGLQGVFTSLHTLRLDLCAFDEIWRGFPDTDQAFLDLLERLSAVCGDTLIHWETCLPPMSVSGDEIGKAFHRFRLLCDIQLPMQTMGSEDTMKDYALCIASHCSKLQFIYVVRDTSYPRPYLVLEVTRKPISGGAELCIRDSRYIN